MIIPLGRIVRFAIATAMRQDEICRITWNDVDFAKRLVTVRDRKDPRNKSGNHQCMPLLNLTGFDAWQLLLEQKILTNVLGRCFPYNSNTKLNFSNCSFCLIKSMKEFRYRNVSYFWVILKC